MVKYSWLLFILLIACKSAQQNNAMQVLPFDQQGHRGCRGLMPENTIPAMLKAIELGVTTLETDAIITKDKQVILSHEPFFNHEITTKPNGEYVVEAEEKGLNMFQMNYAQIATYDVGMKMHNRFPQQQKIPAIKPTLANMIDAAENYCKTNKRAPIRYNIETKIQVETDHIYHPSPEEFVELLVGVIQSKKITERVTIQSFDIRSLQYLHKKYPSIKTAVLIEDFDKKSFTNQIEALGFTPTIYSPHYSLVNHELIEACHSKGIQVIPWTVNDLPTMQRLKKMGVDGIISDYPNLFADL
ncbi:MAG: glycerophosphoryl diester [Chitinophagaceae bacterium]|nr:MAG: glycerophosphoryl diester [Chitinophagaceae bacterium]